MAIENNMPSFKSGKCKQGVKKKKGVGRVETTRPWGWWVHVPWICDSRDGMEAKKLEAVGNMLLHGNAKAMLQIRLFC